MTAFRRAEYNMHFPVAVSQIAALAIPDSEFPQNCNPEAHCKKVYNLLDTFQNKCDLQFVARKVLHLTDDSKGMMGQRIPKNKLP